MAVFYDENGSHVEYENLAGMLYYHVVDEDGIRHITTDEDVADKLAEREGGPVYRSDYESETIRNMETGEITAMDQYPRY